MQPRALHVEAMQSFPAGKLILAITPEGEGRELTQVLSTEFAIYSIVVNHGRGLSRRRRSRPSKLGQAVEQDIVTVFVSEALCDDVFMRCYELLQIDQKPGNILWVEACSKCHELVMPSS